MYVDGEVAVRMKTSAVTIICSPPLVIKRELLINHSTVLDLFLSHFFINYNLINHKQPHKLD